MRHYAVILALLLAGCLQTTQPVVLPDTPRPWRFSMSIRHGDDTAVGVQLGPRDVLALAALLGVGGIGGNWLRKRVKERQARK